MSDTTPKSRIHPLVATAAIAVTALCLVGVAAVTGLLPSSSSTPSPGTAMTAPMTAPVNGTNGNNNLAPPNLAQQPPQLANQNAYPEQAPPLHYAPKKHTAPRPAYADQQPPPVAQAQVCYSCGRVESIEAVQQAAKPSGLGIAAGAILGGVLGHQVGHGNGNTLATVAGAVGGGFAGNEVESRTRTSTTYRVRVRMEDGSSQSFPQSAQEWRVGDPVRVVNGHLEGRG
ncbi:glycine zipper 2TM domain-containing protein [Glaciimonas immobilis]|uniref:Outer membrane lipoprotein SlyB n=1 Tax=Glaciimonas immobilis TaxID=728004 RepID=A0A840RZN7_9BURK|nr:glycine zipper 2TM domain-containing protein [Glaciimonas immobilis]KAF3996217.1 glycine zipper 2TM domain-containing protein [Glaciimonas immobilis]MBB5202568.1 outer membrane lipoprotein SlyB [Glaciimonas immobilis]